ncbi:MAG: hypothetical protein ACREJC_10490, partial [Tepidisphaeraceae bacterium]
MSASKRRLDQLQREYDALLALLIGLAREAQTRGAQLSVQQSTLSNDKGWALATDVLSGADLII